MHHLSHSFESVVWRDGKVVMLDQRELPHHEVFLEFRNVQDLAEAIEKMVIRGAPAIGCAAAFGVVLSTQRSVGSISQAISDARKACERLKNTRPTAVNLSFAVDRMKRVIDTFAGSETARLESALLKEAEAIRNEDIHLCEEIGRFGEPLLPNDAVVLTHCNTGALATAGQGTALGVIRSAVARNKKIRVIANETRPFLQGARLTAWELARDGIDVTVIPDSAAAALMARNMVDLVLVGADRVAANGDVANKIGTYSVALAAGAHNVPFYVAVPWSTIDLQTPTGSDIPIENRVSDEVTHIFAKRVVPKEVPVMNPAFDITPNRLITALITDRGVIRPPFSRNLKRG